MFTGLMIIRKQREQAGYINLVAGAQERLIWRWSWSIGRIADADDPIDPGGYTQYIDHTTQVKTGCTRAICSIWVTTRDSKLIWYEMQAVHQQAIRRNGNVLYCKLGRKTLLRRSGKHLPSWLHSWPIKLLHNQTPRLGKTYKPH